MVVPNNQLPNTNPNQPSQNPPAQPPQGTNNSGGDGETGEGQEISLESLDPKIKAFLERELGKARRAGEKKGKKDADDAAEAERLRLAQENAVAQGEYQTLYNTEKDNHEKTKADLAAAQLENRKIKMAVKVGLPNPLSNYARLINSSDDEALEADANTLKQSFAPEAYRNEQTPPITPDGKGGKHAENLTPNEKDKFTQEKFDNEVKGTKMYSKLF